MTELFLKVFEMSIMGSVVILVTLLARFLLRKRSKRLIMILWAVVAVRLLLPVNIASEISIFNLIPVNVREVSEAYQSQEEAGVINGESDFRFVPDEAGQLFYQNIEYVDASGEITGIETVRIIPAHTEKTTAVPDMKNVLAIVWITGMSVIASYSIVRFVLLKRRLKDAKWIDRNIYESDKVKTPFVFGLFTPKIYLPDVLDNSEREYILKHENTHIEHGDWIIKIIGTAAVAVHWFNPLVWLGYFLLEQDIEMSCDETTVANMDDNMKQAYAISLVAYASSSKNRRYLVTPLGFAKKSIVKSEITGRVNNLVNYKPGTKAATIAITLCLLATSAVCGFDSKTVKEATEEVIVPETVVEPVSNTDQFEYLTEIPYDIEFVTDVPDVVNVSDTEKEVTFYCDGNAINSKLMLPQKKGPHKTIVISGSLHSSYYNEIANRFNAYGYATIQIEAVNILTPQSKNAVLYKEVVDLYAVMDELQYLDDVDVDNVYLLAHSQNSYVSAFTGANKKNEIKGIILIDPVISDAQPITVAISSDVEVTGLVDVYSIFSDCDVKTIMIKGEKSTCQQDSLSKAVKCLPNGELYVVDGADSLLYGQYGLRMVDEAVLTMKSWN